MSKQDYDPEEMREAILEEVISLYNHAAADAGWTKMPPEVEKIKDEIFRLVTKACGIND
jgi:hypothetical protein